MDAELADVKARDLAEAEAEVSALRAALDEARAATRAAEEKLHKRQAEEAEKLQAYEHAYGRMKEAYTAERQRLEDARRAAEEGLLALDSKLEGFSEDVLGSTGGRPGSAPTITERIDALLPADEDSTGTADDREDTPAYEDDWYRALVQRSQSSTGEEGDASTD